MDEILEYTIYSITCINEKIKGIYVGSTCDFNTRQKSHKKDSNNKNKNHKKVYQIINQNGGILNWEFTCLQIRNCTEIDAHALERKWYDKLNADLNTIRPYISDQERKDEAIEYDKLYYEKNKKIILEQGKKLYFANQEKIASQKRQYYIENKVNIDSRNAERILCEPCGTYHRRAEKARHYKSQKHIDNLAKITDE